MEWQRYIKTGIVAALLIGASAYYQTLFPNFKLLSAVNRGFADATLLLLGTILLIGPLSRVYDLFDRLVIYRKEMGILAMLLGLTHVLFIMFPLARSGPFGFYLARPWSAFPGLAALLTMIGLFIISLEKVKKTLGTDRWWKMQYTGVRLTAILVLVHVLVLRYNVVLQWLVSHEPALPSSTVLITIFSTFVILVRLTEFVGKKLARLLIPFWAIALTAASALGKI